MPRLNGRHARHISETGVIAFDMENPIQNHLPEKFVVTVALYGGSKSITVFEKLSEFETFLRKVIKLRVLGESPMFVHSERQDRAAEMIALFTELFTPRGALSKSCAQVPATYHHAYIYDISAYRVENDVKYKVIP